jgi:hypothetical protein
MYKRHSPDVHVPGGGAVSAAGAVAGAGAGGVVSVAAGASVVVGGAAAVVVEGSVDEAAFFLRPKRLLKPFFIWSTASGAVQYRCQPYHPGRV